MMQHLLPTDWNVPPVLATVVTIALTVLAALLAHRLVMRLLCGLAARSATRLDNPLINRAWRPSQWLTVAFALVAARPTLMLGERGHAIWMQCFAIVIPGLLGWLAIAMIRAMQDVVALRADISVADHLGARRKRTRATVLGRVAIVLTTFITLCLMLLSIPSVRAVGVTLMASAGLAGIAVGAAAQPLLKNIIAGIQLAFTEPIRIDDVVIMEGEWGKVEEIHLTYVVVGLWDERRLIVPVSKFLEESFQNWTRTTSQLLGAVMFYLDPATDMDRLRAQYERMVRQSRLWDGRAQVLQVTDTKPEAIEVRGLATARSASDTFDLRCEIREKLLAYIRTEMPEAMPRSRAMIWGQGLAEGDQSG